MPARQNQLLHMRLLLMMTSLVVWLHLCGQSSLAEKVKGQGIYKDNSINTYYNFAVQRQKCKENSLEENTKGADFIFTGTVKDIQPDRNSKGLEKAEVEVKRIIKGLSVINQLPVLYVEGRYAPVWHRVVTVAGIGRSDICISNVRKHDTWIFFTNFVPLDGLRLNSSLIRLSLTNIAQTEAAVKDKNYVHKNEDLPVSCEHKFCPFGGQCVVNHHTKAVECHCLETCSDALSPVCGSDGVTYENECQLRVASCSRQRRIKVHGNSSCDDLDPCRDLMCGFGAKCIPSADRRSAYCQCPEKCEDYGVIDTTVPVCSEDGNQFRDLCQLRKTSCHDMAEIKLRNFGICDPCWNVQCSFFTTCVVDERNQPKCVCMSNCSADGQVVCGSNGLTYRNQCEMELAACHRQQEVFVTSNGSCADLCEGIDCKYGAECRNGTCTCPTDCPADEDPVCATDMITYPNDCVMMSAACYQGNSISVLHAGDCDDELSGIVAPGDANEICQDTSYGCCPDGKSVASGPEYKGCSSSCRCHHLGSYTKNCDPISGQCSCKQGVGGLRCDRCEPNYWGMPKIAEGNDGCMPCECDIRGSLREDCEQMSGWCMCQPFVTGAKCDTCADGSQITDSGCPDDQGYIPGNETAADGGESVNSDIDIFFEKQTTTVTENPSTAYMFSTIKPTQTDYHVPFFSGMSYIRLKKLEHGTRAMSIEIKFRPLAPNGLILYTGQLEDGMGDFISVSLSNGHVEFRYDLGSGPALLKTKQQVTLKKLHKITATRQQKDGLLKLDDDAEASAVSPGSLRSLNIGSPLYLGYVPNLNSQIAKSTGANSGFVGCIQMLRIASTELNNEYELSKATSTDIEDDNNISDCDLNSCKTVLCNNGGMCIHHEADTYACSCPIGYTGGLCEDKLKDGQ